MPLSTRLLALLLTALLCSGAFAQTPAAADTPAPPSALRQQLAAIPTQPAEDGDISQSLAAMDTIRTQAELLVADRKSQLAELDNRLAQLGTAPEKGTGTEVVDIVQQRAALQKQRDALDNDLKLARLVATDAQQFAKDLVTQRRARFTERLTERTDSPLSVDFWRNLAASWPSDMQRLAALADSIQTQFNAAATVRTPAGLWAMLAGALLMAVLGIWWIERRLVQRTPGTLPPGRLRRTMLAVTTVVAHVLVVGLAAQAMYWALNRQTDLALPTLNFSQEAVRFSMFAAFLVGLGRALLSHGRSSWRLMPLTDATAARLRPLPWLTALVSTLVWLFQHIGSATDASLAADVSAHAFTTLALTGLVAVLLLRLRSRPASATDTDTHASASDGPEPPPPWLAPALGLAWVMLAAAWVLLALGFVALAHFIAFQIVWTGIVSATFYLLFKFADDLFMTLLAARSNFGQRMQASFNASPHLLDQIAVVLSGLSRLALFFYMVIALLAPFGTSPGELFQRSGRFGSGIQVGEIQLVPQALFNALGVAFAGLLALRVFKHWLDHKYLPRTTLEPGMRSSITTLLGYAGTVMVVALALSALGISVERIAWVASALSVGIGFGLQAIVQNFISGLILLAERPVKVGDWVVLGSTEGDVKRINVRATEIQLGDRSTLIVPNSEFITKSVRNMTLTNAEGRVQVRLPMPLNTDANRVREVMMAAFLGHSGVLEEPAPSVQLDGIDAGYLIFIGTAYVHSPRVVGGVRSDLLFSILEGLKTADLPLAAYAFTVAAGDSKMSPVLPKPLPPPAETV